MEQAAPAARPEQAGLLAPAVPRGRAALVHRAHRACTQRHVQTSRERNLDLAARGSALGFHREKTRKLAEELGGLRAYEHWRELVQSDDVELVSIVTPPAEHREMATAALEVGKHVLSEKPTALHAREAEQLVAAAREHAQQLALIDHELRFLPAWRAAREAMHELGAIRYAEVRYASPGRGDRSRAWNWWSDAERGGGIWGAVGSHFVDAPRYFGLEIEAVQATLHTAIKERPFGEGARAVTSDDVAFVNLRLTNGAMAMMSFSVVASGPDEPASLTIHGEDSAMRFVSEEVLFAKRGEPFTRRLGDDLANRPGNSPGGAFGSGTIHLGRALRAALDEGDRNALSPAATFADGLAQQHVLDAARRSNANDGRWERV